MSSAAQALRRLPLAEALTALRAGEGSAPLSSGVKALAFRFVDKNSEPGPREFLRAIAPRIAYANPDLPFSVERIRDPRTKSINPQNPDIGAKWEGGEQPGASLVIEFHSGPEKTIPVRHLSAEQIWEQIVEVGGLAPVATEAE